MYRFEVGLRLVIAMMIRLLFYKRCVTNVKMSSAQCSKCFPTFDSSSVRFPAAMLQWKMRVVKMSTLFLHVPVLQPRVLE